MSLGAYAGMRFTQFGVDIGTQAAVVGGFQGQGRSVSTGFNWAEPLIGLRGEIRSSTACRSPSGATAAGSAPARS
jgi:hypothetical protein